MAMILNTLVSTFMACPDDQLSHINKIQIGSLTIMFDYVLYWSTVIYYIDVGV
jgi:hypothetical protein